MTNDSGSASSTSATERPPEERSGATRYWKLHVPVSAVFEGMEMEGQLPAEPKALRKEYLRLFDEYISQLKRGCREMGMDYVQMPTDQPLDVALSQYLAHRMKAS